MSFLKNLFGRKQSAEDQDTGGVVSSGTDGFQGLSIEELARKGNYTQEYLYQRNLFGLQQTPEGAKPGDIFTYSVDDLKGPPVVRWTLDPLGLSIEECARKGIEALAGILIDGDAFGVSQVVAEQTMTVCAEFYYSELGAEDAATGDFIGAYLRTVEWIEGGNISYPMIGNAKTKMIIQSVSDGIVFARWNDIDFSRGEESIHGVGMMSIDENLREGYWVPTALGDIPSQEVRDQTLPSFLVIHTPAPEWQIWRRFSPMGGKEEPREESYVRVFPSYDPSAAWRFRTHRDADGGTRVEMV